MNAKMMLPQKPTLPVMWKIAPSRKPPISAPATPTTMSAMQPNPRPATTRAAIAPAIKPTMIQAIHEPGSRLIFDTRRASAAKVPESSQDLEGLLLGFEQGRRVGPNAAESVRPLRTGRALGMEPERRWVKEDPLPLYLLDHWSLGQYFFERLTARQPPRL